MRLWPLLILIPRLCLFAIARLRLCDCFMCTMACVDLRCLVFLRQ